MKPKIKYLNGCIEVCSDGSVWHLNKMRASSFMTEHPSREDRYYFFVTRRGAEFYKKFYTFFNTYWDVDPMVDKMLLNFKDYTGEHKKIPKVDLKEITLKPYQEISVDKMLRHDKYCIFLGQGTGKTITALTYINSAFRHEGPSKVLVLTPKKVIGQYMKQAVIYLGEDWASYLTVINYESLHKVVNNKYNIAIFDESQNLKGHSSQANAQATQLNSKRKYLFTGSPQDKQKHEILAQLKVMNPWLFPAKTKVFKRYFTLDFYGNPKKDIEGTELDEIIAAMSYGEQTENLLDLPKANHKVIECEFEDNTMYKQLAKHSVLNVEGTNMMVDTAGVLRMKLRQICNGFVNYERFDDETCLLTKERAMLHNPKKEPLRKLIKEMETGIIFTQFDLDINVVEEVLREEERTYVWVNGKINGVKSDTRIDRFKAGEVDFLVIQSKSGNAGLDLQNTNNMIFYSLPESYITFEQCLYRIRRIGQTKECNYYYLIVNDSVEVALYKALNSKESFNKKMFELYRKEVRR